MIKAMNVCVIVLVFQNLLTEYGEIKSIVSAEKTKVAERGGAQPNNPGSVQPKVPGGAQPNVPETAEVGEENEDESVVPPAQSNQPASDKKVKFLRSRKTLSKSFSSRNVPKGKGGSGNINYSIAAGVLLSIMAGIGVIAELVYWRPYLNQQ